MNVFAGVREAIAESEQRRVGACGRARYGERRRHDSESQPPHRRPARDGVFTPERLQCGRLEARQPAKESPAKPTSVMAQVEGSGASIGSAFSLARS
jgi:hypothetical protein